MELRTMAPRPKPTPSWQGITLAAGVAGLSQIGIVGTGVLGRTEGYDDRANALRAARMLTRGSVRDAAAVIGYEGRWYVEGVRAFDSLWGAWKAPLRFEGQFPALVGKHVITAATTFYRHLGGLEAIVDGSRELKLA